MQTQWAAASAKFREAAAHGMSSHAERRNQKRVCFHAGLPVKINPA